MPKRLNPGLLSTLTCAALAAVAVVGAFTPSAAAAAPSATMSPSTEIHDGQIVTIRASGFDPNRDIQVVECRGTAGSLPKDLRSCEGVTMDSSGYADRKGNYLNMLGDPSGQTQGYYVSYLPSAKFKLVSIHCDPTNPCVLYVGEQLDDFSKPHTFVPFTFAGAVGAATTTAKHSGGGGTATTVIAIIAVVAVAAVFVVVRRSRDLRSAVR